MLDGKDMNSGAVECRGAITRLNIADNLRIEPFAKTLGTRPLFQAMKAIDIAIMCL